LNFYLLLVSRNWIIFKRTLNYLSTLIWAVDKYTFLRYCFYKPIQPFLMKNILSIIVFVLSDFQLATVNPFRILKNQPDLIELLTKIKRAKAIADLRLTSMRTKWHGIFRLASPLARLYGFGGFRRKSKRSKFHRLLTNHVFGSQGLPQKPLQIYNWDDYPSWDFEIAFFERGEGQWKHDLRWSLAWGIGNLWNNYFFCHLGEIQLKMRFGELKFWRASPIYSTCR